MMYTYKKPDILSHIPPHGHVIIEASAGTGKTYTLEHLLVELLLGHDEVDLGKILTVTFTERATHELKVRIRQMLWQIVHAKRVETGEQEEGSWTFGEKERQKIERAYFSFDQAPIYTIHSFCQRILTQYAFAHRRHFDQRHVEFGPLFERVVTQSIRTTLARDKEMRCWIEAWLEREDLESLKQMLSRCASSHAELWPKFSEPDLLPLMEKFGDTFWSMYRTLYARTCHQREKAFLRAQESWQQERNFARFLMLIDKELVAFQQSLLRCTPETPEQHEFCRLAAKLVQFKPATAQKFLPVLHDQLEREKRRSGVYTYDDMLSMVWESLNQPSGAWLTKTLRSTYRFAVIDEFQDTDDIQWNIFEHLFGAKDASGRLFVIGDPKQAIYGFRGADVYTYLDAKNQLLQGAQDGRAQATEVFLEHNFRSTSTLIDAYNHLFDQTHSSPFFSSPEIRYTHPVKCGQPDLVALDGQGQPLAPIVVGQITRSSGSNAGLRADDIRACYARWIATEIEAILTGSKPIEFGQSSATARVRPKDIYILTRTHRDELGIEPYLRERGIPYVLYKEEGLFETRQAREVLDLLRAIERPHDRGRRLLAWGSPFFDVPFEELMRCREVPEHHPLYKMLLDWHHLARAQRFEQLFTDILERSGLIRREIFFGDSDKQLRDVEQVFDVLLEEAQGGRLDFGELVSHCHAFVHGSRKPVEDRNLKRADHVEDAVQLMTMHKSKGLEAALVFLYPFGGGGGEYWNFHYRHHPADPRRVRAMHILKPDKELKRKLHDRVNQEADEEAERLLYVALTRAKARLYLPYIPYGADSRPIYKRVESLSYHVVNRKLKEVVEKLEAGELEDLFVHEQIPYFGLSATQPSEQRKNADLLIQWQPKTLKYGDHPIPWTPSLLPKGRQVGVRSYTSIKRQAGGYDQLALSLGTNVARDELGGTAGEVRQDELPGGVRTGLFLHQVLEEIDYATLSRHQDLEDWAKDREVRGVFAKSMEEHDLDPGLLGLSQRVIWRALTGVVELPGAGDVVYGLGFCQPHVKEMEFLYPLTHRGRAGVQAEVMEEVWNAESGYIKGYIDYVFIWQSRVYFVDWKSDVLDRYEPKVVASHFDTNYWSQVMLYSIALCRAFGIRDGADYEARFGGAVYCFLRGMQEDGDTGLHGARPSWAQLQDYERQV